MTLADKYMHILQNINTSSYQSLQETASSHPVLVSLLLHQLPNRQNLSLKDLLIVSRQLKQTQIEYLLENINSKEYLNVIKCLSKGDFKVVRKHIENIFFNRQQIQFKILAILLTHYHVIDGAIEKSQQLWNIINQQLASESVIPLLQKLSAGKAPEKVELGRVLNLLKMLRGSHYQSINKIDIGKVVQTKHSLIRKQSLVAAIIKIVLKLPNQRMQNKISNQVLQFVSQNVEHWIELTLSDQLINLIKAALRDKKQSKQHIELIMVKLISNAKINIQMLIQNDYLIPIALKLFQANSSLIHQCNVLLKLQKIISHKSHLYQQFLKTVSPFLFSKWSKQESLEIISNIPKQFVECASNFIKIPEQIINKNNKISNNQALLCLIHLTNPQRYGDMINQQISELRKQSYVDLKDILRLIKHTQYLLQYSNIQINPSILFLIQQLFMQKIWNINTSAIYSNISCQQTRSQNLIKHYSVCIKIEQNIQHLHPHLLQLLGNTRDIPLCQVQQFLKIIQKYEMQDEYLNSIYKIHLNNYLPQSKYLQSDKLHQLKQTAILTSLIQKYNLKIQWDINQLKSIRPSPAFIQYLQKASPALLAQLFQSDWHYYKQMIKNGFFQLYQKQMTPKVYPINFRGSLFNDMPLVFQYLTDHKQQPYFSNYSAYMSLLYLQILCQNPKLNKKQLIRFLFDRVAQTNKNKKQLNGEYYTNLIWWRMFVFASYRLLDADSKQQIQYIVNFLLKDIENKSLPVLRQNMELLFYRLLCLDNNLVHTLLDKLKNQNAVNINAPVILSLGLFMLDNRSQQIFSVLITYISSHTAYVRALAQYYCFEYLKLEESKISEREDFLQNISRFIEQSKDSKKLMKNIRNGVQLFNSLVKNLNVRALFIINFEKCEGNVISGETFDQLEAEGRKYLVSIFKYIHPELKPAAEAKISQIHHSQQIAEPAFQQYIELHQRPQELIIVASLLQKSPNFGHLVRTCSQYPNITLCFPTRNILNQPDYKQLLPEQYKCTIIELKQKDLLKYLAVQKQRDYKLIALEQTSNSVTIDKFQFPKRAVIVLGNERIGMGSTIIDMMDHLVEIQQFGKVRSLNVHVSSVILLWSYKKGRMI